jgi:hypothetical protein
LAAVDCGYDILLFHAGVKRFAPLHRYDGFASPSNVRDVHPA